MIEPGELAKAAATYLDQHREDLVREACATLESFAQNSKARKTRGTIVQMSGAK
jgi:hypothetical protein